MKKNIIFCVVIHYHAYNALKKTLKSIHKLQVPKNVDLLTVVVDQEAYDKEQEYLKKTYSSTIWLNEKNMGVGGAFNKGLTYGYKKNGSYFFLLPADMTMNNDVFSQLLRKIGEDPTIGMICPKVLFTTTPPKILFVGGKIDPKAKSSIHIGYNEIDKNQYNAISETELLNCPVLIKREVLDAIGFMDSTYFMYYEDTDFYFRARRAGYSLRVVPGAIAYTDVPPLNEKIMRRKDYYISRNLLYFIKKNFSLSEQIVAYLYVVREAWYLLIDMLNSQKKGRAYYKLLGMRDFLLQRKGKVKLSL